MDLPTRCALLTFALLNHLDRFAINLGLQRAPQAQRNAAGSVGARSSSSKKDSA